VEQQRLMSDDIQEILLLLVLLFAAVDRAGGWSRGFTVFDDSTDFSVFCVSHLIFGKCFPKVSIRNSAGLLVLS
jgi:hypothetical protein